MILPKRLKKGDHVRVIAPAESLSPKFKEPLRQRGIDRLKELGLEVSFGKYVNEPGPFKSAIREHRLKDLHEAFEDDTVDAVISANGGSSANQLLKHLDYELIKKKPKIFCGLSDITELTSAIHAKTGLVTYYGPHFTMLGASEHLGHVLKNMKKCFFSEESFEVQNSEYFSNSEWEKELILNEGFWTINEGEVEADCLGGNMLTLNFLLGYEFIPDIAGKILFLEENHLIDYRGIQKELQQILNHPQGSKIKGLLIGRFQRESKMNRKLLEDMIKSKEELSGIPVVGNVNCSHTIPMSTFPFGGRLKFSAKKGDKVRIEIIKH
ncbi:MAG: S66 peptidase family protein [Salinimicrobium sp.]